MKFTNSHTAAAYAIASAGLALTEVGMRSTEGAGPMWQGLVRANRTNLIRAGIEGELYKAIKPGHDRLVWLIEDEPGHVIEHKSTDCDTDGHAERIAELTDSFITVTAHYLSDDGEPVNYDDYDEGVMA